MVMATPTEKDIQFVQFIYDQTQNGKLHWEATADPAKFVVSFKGKYKVTLDKNYDEDRGKTYFYLTLLDDSERELLTIFDSKLAVVKDLFYLAEREALKVDTAIDEIMGGGPSGSGKPITDEDIPF